MKKSIVIIGMGPGLSMGIAEKFGGEGYYVKMISRNAEKLESYKNHLASLAIDAEYRAADVADTDQLISALRSLAQTGSIDVVSYNAVDARMTPILEDHIDELTNGFKISVGNALETAKELWPKLAENKGTLLLTGGATATHPNPDMGSISLGKAGIKNLAYQLHAVLQPKGVFVGTVTVAGWITPDSKTHSPKQIAEVFWNLNRDRNAVEVVF